MHQILTLFFRFVVFGCKIITFLQNRQINWNFFCTFPDYLEKYVYLCTLGQLKTDINDENTE